MTGKPQVDHVGRFRARDELLHVEHGGGVEHGAALGDGQDGEGVVDAQGSQAGAVDGVDGDVALGAGAVADVLAVEKHGGFVLLAFADNHNAVEVDGLEEGAHGVDGCAVSLVLVAEAHPVATGDCRGFGDADKFKGKVAVRLVNANGKRRGNRGVLLGHRRW